MENAVQSKSNDVPARDIGEITSEINELRRQATCIQVAYAVEIGRRLVEAKSVLPYGAWGDWLKEKVSFSQSTANNLMRIFEEYGSSQISIFGAFSNSQTIGNLPYSKALQLLSIPADERERFAQDVHADELSVKELKKAIDERDAARKEAEEAKAVAAEISEKMEQAEAARAEAEALASAATKLEDEIENLKASLKKAEEKSVEADRKLKEAEANPKMPPKALKKIKDEASETAREKAEKDFSAKIAEAQTALASAEEKRAAAERKALEAERALETAQKKLKTASPAVASFEALFIEIQKLGKTLKEKVDTIRKSDPETADKLSAALKAFGASL